MSQYDCPRDNCEYMTPNFPDAVAVVLLQDHCHTMHPAAQSCGAVKKAKPPSIALPEVARDIFDDEWCSFLNAWESFKNTIELSEDSVNRYLLSFCGEELRSSVLKAIKKLAVVSVAICTLQSELI